jgi:nucleotide-binding universal stress UspA family protein
VNCSADSSPTQQALALAGPFRRVLVAWDGSADSVAALRTATAIVGSPSGHVVALSVLPAGPHSEAGNDEPANASAQARHVRLAFAATTEVIARTSPVRIDLHTAENPRVAASLCDYAEQHGFDLLVIGRHGDGGLMHPKLGHVAETACRSCKIPVLLVSA